MSDYPPYTSMSSPQAGQRAEKLRRLVWIMYILFAATIISGFTLIIGVIIAHIKEQEAAFVNPPLASHISWLIRTFWWTLAWSVAAAVFYALFITAPLGALISLFAAIWFMYRVVRGALRLHRGKAMPLN
ncbi:MAG: hypothetical protein R6V55_09390 [Desulfovermiculus sp.]